MKLFNSLSRQVEEIVPINDRHIGMYACGPTVYDYAHIGHMRRYVGDDVLKRALEYVGYEVKLVMNITDVGHLVSDEDEGEDKMEKGARKSGLSVWQVAEKFTQQFFDSTDKLNIKRPDIVCKATDNIEEQIRLIKLLEEKGFTYVTSDGVYYDTSKFADYNLLSRMDLNEIKEGARVEVNEEKRNKSDFALWKFSPKDVQRQMEWDSPWGIGFPGWHIECSAMSMKYLGEQFDIHSGGIDHIPVHHTNEIAQAEAATGKKPFVKYWVHHNFLRVENQKMSKSLENVYTVQDLMDKGYDPMSLRYLFLTSHYRSEMNFTWEALAGARSARERLVNVLRDIKSDEGAINKTYEERFKTAIENDLNAPEALALVWEVIKSNLSDEEKYRLIINWDKVLGLRLEEEVRQVNQVKQEVMDLVNKREEARKNKNWGEADRLREEIKKMGFEILDSESGTKLEPV